MLSFELKDKALHLFDIIAPQMPSLEQILEHLPEAIEEIYFYFSPDLLTEKASLQPHVYDKSHLMVHGKWPTQSPFMVSPLSRC